MTAPITGFLQGLLGGAQQGYALRADIEDRKATARERERRAGIEGADLKLRQAADLRAQVGQELAGEEFAYRVGEGSRQAKRQSEQDTRQAALDARDQERYGFGIKRQAALPKEQAARDAILHRYRLEEIAAQNAGRLDVAGLRGAGGPKMSTALLTALKNNDQRLRVMDSALANLDRYPNAVGLKGLVPDIALQRMDPSGVSARADIADIGSMVIHDRSGAAVTVSEAPRLRPFIPTVTDTPDTIRRKLTRMRQIIAEDTEFLRANGSPGVGGGVGAGGGPTASGQPSKADRWEELVDNGVPPDEATRQVQQEYGP